MSDTKHTPGPWGQIMDTPCRNFEGEIFDKDKFRIAIITGYNHHCMFGGPDRMWSGNDDNIRDQDYAEHCANSKLIAQSPALLKILKEIVCDGFSVSSNHIAEAVIKAAEGEQLSNDEKLLIDDLWS